MKIAQILTVLNGGAGISAFRLHEELRKQPDIESHIIQRFHIEDQNYAKKHNISTAPIGSSLITRLRKKYNLHPEHFNGKHIYKHPSNYEVATFARSSYRLEELPIVKKADIIHLHWVADFVNFPTFFKRIKQPIVWTLHDMNPFQGMFHYEEDLKNNSHIFEKLNNKILQEKIKSVHQKKDIYVVTPSQWMRDKSQNSQTLGKYPHFVIPYGLDLKLYPPINPKEAKKELGVDNANPVLMTIAQDINLQRKGADLFYNAIESIERPLNVITVGGDKKVIRNEKVNHIHFNYINEISRLNTIYAASDLMVLSSREDNLPNTMIESFINGTPVISFRNGGMAEHVRKGDTGILVDEINSKALAENIIDFLDNKYNFDRNKIRQYALDNFDMQQQISSYIELYQNILGIK